MHLLCTRISTSFHWESWIKVFLCPKMEEGKHIGQDLGRFKPPSLGPRILYSPQELAHHGNSINICGRKEGMKDGWYIIKHLTPGLKILLCICCATFGSYEPASLFVKVGIIILAWFHSVLLWIQGIRGSTMGAGDTKKCNHYLQ